MKVTIDSNEPLSDAVRVLGALYDVTLVVSEVGRGQGEDVATVSAKSSSAMRATRKAAAVKPRTSRPNGKVAKPAAPVSNAEVRSWARQNGLTVSGRGRVAAQVIAAYREAHRG